MKKLYRIEISPKKFWFIFVPGFFTTIGLLFTISYFAIDKLVMPKLIGTKSRGEITVPNVVHLSGDSAKVLCAANGLRMSESRTEYNDSVPANTIISQDPAPGSIAKQGRHVMIVLSKGSEIATIPTVSGMQEVAGKRVLRAAGFSNIATSSMFSASVKEGCSIGTDPTESTITSREGRITLLISKGVRPTKAEVPNLLGEKLSDAKIVIETAGLQIGSITYESQPETSAGIVLRQSATAGSSIPLESSVNIVVSIE